MIDLILLITLISGILYFLLSVWYSWGFTHIKRERSFKKRTVSVIIACRNEEKNLPRLLNILLNQTYSEELFEVIIANDCSEDNSESILKEYSSKHSVINYFNVQGRENVISPKKNALTQAIAKSTGEIILLTDADCFPRTTWIETMVQGFQDDTSMVAGYSATELEWKEAPFVQKFEHIDVLCLFIGLSGGFAIGKQFTCIGQNLAYTREAYDKVGGFSKIKHIISGDDCNFMQLVRLEGMKIKFNFDKKSFVKTKPIENWKKLFNQHSRWFSNLKLMLKLNTQFFVILTLLFVFYIGIVASIFIDMRWFLLFFSLKSIGELQMFFFAYPKLNANRRLIWFFPVWMVIQTIFNILTIFFGQLNMFMWHGKKQNIVKRKDNEIYNS
ncbi:MAG: hypothetical protein B6226_00260 [Candidatus Cloacimonetes bacterium 4572_65]|nr:MAG: hypothetical protein B6226_00260 [Candidatus Cloacimonetes bacterium 4572_65]